MPLSLKEPQTVELARAHAEKIGVPMNIAVVDRNAAACLAESFPVLPKSVGGGRWRKGQYLCTLGQDSY